MTGSGGIGGNPIVGATPCPVCDLQAHASTQWCLAANGNPVVVITSIFCDDGIALPPVVQFVDPATGDPVPLQAIVPCGDKDWEVNQLCDFDPDTGDLIATFTQIFEWDEDQGTLVVNLVRADNPAVPYVPVGEVRSCVEREPQIDVEWEVLCDDSGPPTRPVPFLRRYLRDAFTDITTVNDFALDGITPYVQVGTTRPCSQDVEWELLCDDPGSGTKPIPFLRRISTDPHSGASIVTNFTLDAVTPYVVTGTVRKCEHDVEWVLLCDDLGSGAKPIPFLRRFSTDPYSGTTLVVNTTLDGTTAYAPVGTVRRCSHDIEWIMLCDDPGSGAKPIPFLRRLSTDPYSGTTLVVNTTLDGVSVYAPVGTVRRCEHDVEWQMMCDNPAGGSTKPIPFLRRLSTDPFSGITLVSNFTLDGVTPYVITGTVERCSDQFTAPSDGPGKTHFEAAVENGSTDMILYTPPAGQIAHVTSMILTAINDDLANVGRLAIRNGAGGTIKLPMIMGDAATGASSSASIGAPSFIEPMEFSTNIYIDVIAGILNYSVSVVGYTEAA